MTTVYQSIFETDRVNVHEHIIPLLIEESRNADGIKSSWHAACLVYKKRIISIGHNKRKSHPQMALFQTNHNRIFLHAEVDAGIKAINAFGSQDILKKCELFVIRTTKKHSYLAESFPCTGCQRFISAMGIQRVYHS